MDTVITAVADSQQDEFGGFDLMLLGVFFISYSILALVQINNLFSDRFVWFVGLTVGAFLVFYCVGLMDFGGFCAGTSSSIVCRNDGAGLAAFALMWVYVSAAMLAMFGCVKIVRALKAGR